MRIALFVVTLFLLASAHARAPKRIEFQDKAYPQVAELDRIEPINFTSRYDNDCQMPFYSIPDSQNVYTRHPLFDDRSAGHLIVKLDGKSYHGSQFFSAQDSYWSPFDDSSNYTNTLVYLKSEDCLNETDPLRILMGISDFDESSGVISPAINYRIGWELHSDNAYLFGPDKTNRVLSHGKVVEWYP